MKNQDLSIFNTSMHINSYLQLTYNRVIATIAVGDNPAGIAITPDNRFAYVANNNNTFCYS